MTRLTQRVTLTIEAVVETDAEVTDYGVPRSPRLLEPVGQPEIVSVTICGEETQATGQSQEVLRTMVLAELDPDEWEETE